MKERQILFSAPMVRAILDNTKTQTRRAVKPFEVTYGTGVVPADLVRRNEDGFSYRSTCPYGQPGDLLWVKETFFAWGRWETRFSEKKRRDEWHFIDMTSECEKDYLFAADGFSDTKAFTKRRDDRYPMYWKRPAIFMPRLVSRITLEVTGVRVERLNEISVQDAWAEGCVGYDDDVTGGQSGYGEFFQLWESINGKGSWDLNPWVWVVEFKRLPTNPNEVQ